MFDLIISSPPFEESLSGKGACPEQRLNGKPFGQGKSIDLADYGDTKGQLGRMKGGSVMDVAKKSKGENRQVKELTWDGCYDGNWNGMIVPDAFSHPAKYARGLIERIIKHGLEEGLWKKGDLCIDPFGGIATGGIVCAYKGIRWVGCELESKFVELAEKNFKLHERTWKNLGLPLPRIVQGDSRQLALTFGSICNECKKQTSDSVRNVWHDSRKTGEQIEGKVGQGVLFKGMCKDREGSVDFGESEGKSNLSRERYQELSSSTCKGGKRKGKREIQTRKDGGQIRLSEEKGEQMRNMSDNEGTIRSSQEQRPLRQPGRKPSDVVQLVPYVFNNATPSEGEKRRCPICQKQWTCRVEMSRLGEVLTGAGCVVSSPPYAESVKGEHEETETAKESRDKRRTKGGSLGKSARHGGYGKSGGQLGAMKAGEVGAVVSSPPYEGSEETPSCGQKKVREKWGSGGDAASRAGVDAKYGESNGQVGHTSGETFWNAAKTIVQQCCAVLRSGGYAVWVTKDFVRAKARVPFTDDWIRLCESCGFRLVKRVRTMLVKETRRQGFTGEIVTKKERKSFFRRLAEKKGSPRIDWEDVTFFIKEEK